MTQIIPAETPTIDPIKLGLDGLRPLMRDIGEPAYRAEQILRYALKATPPSRMTTLPAALRERLSSMMIPASVTIERELPDARGESVKYLYRLHDDHIIEGVRMRYHHGDTLCVSTQVGCRMGCVFCASTMDGLARQLSPGEMLGQFAAASERRPIHNVVLMGSGEPLDNYDNVVAFLRALRDPMGFNVGMRRVSLSTCGLTDAMTRFAGEDLPATLCVSLHAPDDAIRHSLIPASRQYPLREVMSACKHYLRATGRRVIYEYAMIDGVNDSVECANSLAALLRGTQCHVNLIPLNPIPERDLRPSSEPAIRQFQQTLEERGISVTRRRTLGDTVQGACGQLRRGILHNTTHPC